MKSKDAFGMIQQGWTGYYHRIVGESMKANYRSVLTLVHVKWLHYPWWHWSGCLWQILLEIRCSLSSFGLINRITQLISTSWLAIFWLGERGVEHLMYVYFLNMFNSSSGALRFGSTGNEMSPSKTVQIVYAMQPQCNICDRHAQCGGIRFVPGLPGSVHILCDASCVGLLHPEMARQGTSLKPPSFAPTSNKSLFPPNSAHLFVRASIRNTSPTELQPIVERNESISHQTPPPTFYATKIYRYNSGYIKIHFSVMHSIIVFYSFRI